MTPLRLHFGLWARTLGTWSIPILALSLMNAKLMGALDLYVELALLIVGMLVALQARAALHRPAADYLTQLPGRRLPPLATLHVSAGMALLALGAFVHFIEVVPWVVWVREDLLAWLGIDLPSGIPSRPWVLWVNVLVFPFLLFWIATALQTLLDARWGPASLTRPLGIILVMAAAFTVHLSWGRGELGEDPWLGSWELSRMGLVALPIAALSILYCLRTWNRLGSETFPIEVDA